MSFLTAVYSCVQLGDELNRVKQEIEERGNSMVDGGNVTEVLL